MSEMNVTPATEAASSDTRDFLSSMGESEKRVRVSGKAVSDEVVLSTKDVNVYYATTMHCTIRRSTSTRARSRRSLGLRAAVSRPSCVASTS